MTPQPRLNCKPHSLPQLCASPTLHSIANIVTKTRRKPWERCTPTQPKRNGTFRMCQSIQVALATFSILFTNLYSVLGFLSPQPPHNHPHPLNSPTLPPPSRIAHPHPQAQHLPHTRRRSARHGSQPQRPKPWKIVREVPRQGLQGRAARYQTWPVALARAPQCVSCSPQRGHRDSSETWYAAQHWAAV